MTKKTEQEKLVEEKKMSYKLEFDIDGIQILLHGLKTSELTAKISNKMFDHIVATCKNQENEFTELNKKPIEVGKPIKKKPDGANSKNDNVKKFPKK